MSCASVLIDNLIVSLTVCYPSGTAEEILTQCDGRLDMVVVGAGSGGSVVGIGRKFREKLPTCKVM